jgi:DNA-damage-inducible protein J
MSQMSITASVDEQVQREAQQVLDDYGLTVEEAFSLMMRRIALAKEMPFPVLIPNAETIAAMEDAIRNEGNLPHFTTVAALLEELDGEPDEEG